jgi:hypothetical protein
MKIDTEFLASVRTEYDLFREDLRHIEHGEWKGVSHGELQLLRARMRRLAMMVALNDLPEAKPH